MKEIRAKFDRNLRHTIAGLLKLHPTNTTPECAYTERGVLVCHKDRRYLVSPDGNTVWLASPEMAFPLEGCRYPLHGQNGTCGDSLPSRPNGCPPSCWP